MFSRHFNRSIEPLYSMARPAWCALQTCGPSVLVKGMAYLDTWTRAQDWVLSTNIKKTVTTQHESTAKPHSNKHSKANGNGASGIECCHESTTFSFWFGDKLRHVYHVIYKACHEIPHNDTRLRDQQAYEHRRAVSCIRREKT